jgi:hypothetical protein
MVIATSHHYNYHLSNNHIQRFSNYLPANVSLCKRASSRDFDDAFGDDGNGDCTDDDAARNRLRNDDDGVRVVNDDGFERFRLTPLPFTVPPPPPPPDDVRASDDRRGVDTDDDDEVDDVDDDRDNEDVPDIGDAATVDVTSVADGRRGSGGGNGDDGTLLSFIVVLTFTITAAVVDVLLLFLFNPLTLSLTSEVMLLFLLSLLLFNETFSFVLVEKVVRVFDD